MPGPNRTHRNIEPTRAPGTRFGIFTMKATQPPQTRGRGMRSDIFMLKQTRGKYWPSNNQPRYSKKYAYSGEDDRPFRLNVTAAQRVVLRVLFCGEY